MIGDVLHFSFTVSDIERSIDPTIIIEARDLHQTKGPVTFEGPVDPIRGATFRRRGTDIAIVTWGTTTAKAEEAEAVRDARCDLRAEPGSPGRSDPASGVDRRRRVDAAELEALRTRAAG